MPYESLSLEQKARADALQVASTCFGSPKESYDDDLVRAAQWILTGDHPALPHDLDGTDETPGTINLDGGNVTGQSDTAEPTGPQIPVG